MVRIDGWKFTRYLSVVGIFIDKIKNVDEISFALEQYWGYNVIKVKLSRNIGNKVLL